MIGGIYSDEKCPVCGGRFVDNHKNALVCPNHPEHRAQSFRIQFRGLNKRFKDYPNAEQTLQGWRYKSREDIFDPRDYQKDNPLGFESLATLWLKGRKEGIESGKLLYHTYRESERYMVRLSREWGNKNVKAISALDLDLLEKSLSKEYSSKTKDGVFMCLRGFFRWVKKLYIKNLEVPEFPEYAVSMGFRKPLSKEQQFAVLDELKRIAPAKVYVAVLWLATYPAIRPKEMRSIRECDIDFNLGKFIIHKHKTARHTGGPKLVSMLDEDLELARPLLSRPEERMLPFFRLPGKKKQFGHCLLWKYWTDACKNLKIEGTSLYAGTKHTSIMELRKRFSPETIKKNVQITSDKFNRYLTMSEEDERNLFASARGSDVVLTLNLSQYKRAKS